MTAIIAEKPSVARDIARVLGVAENKDGYMEGNGYMVTWAFGHLVGLAPPEQYGMTVLPMIPATFKLVSRREKTANGYEPDRAAMKQLKVIKSVFDRCSDIVVATDAGREGENIFRYIYQYLDCKKPFSRLWISSLTDKAISEGFTRLRPGSDYDSLFYAADARAKSDWLVGINASRALACVTGDDNNSLGRVQTPALAMVCARYEENRSFRPQPYWVFKAGIEKDGVMFRLTGKERTFDKAKADELFDKLGKDQSIKITGIQQKEVCREPPLLYDLTSLQQDANKRHGFTAEQTLNIAQKLYEGKLTSYPRTGSRYISEDVFAEIPGLITSLENHLLFGKHVAGMDLENLNKKSVDDQKITGHHALIITGNQSEKLGTNDQIIYEMIAGRMLEAFSPRCVMDVQVTQAESGSGMLFETKGVKIREAGWKAVFNLTEEKQEDEEDQQLPPLTEGETFQMYCSNMLGKKTTPKQLYTEATLLAAMEHAGRGLEEEQQREALAGTGIGTPATRAAIIEILFKREYMEREKKNLVPTEKGIRLYEAIKNLQIADAALTGDWESNLNRIEKEPDYRDAFLEGIKEYTRQVVVEISSLQFSGKNKDIPCPKCKTGQVSIRGKAAKCNAPKCNLTVFRSVCGKTVSESQVVELLKKGKTSLIKGFKNKKGVPFDAKLKFDEGFNVVFEFSKR